MVAAWQRGSVQWLGWWCGQTSGSRPGRGSQVKAINALLSINYSGNPIQSSKGIFSSIIKNIDVTSYKRNLIKETFFLLCCSKGSGCIDLCRYRIRG